MGFRCVVKTCQERRTENPRMHFHRFPMGDPFRLNLWLIALNISGVTKEKLRQCFVCERHFLPEDYAAMKKKAKRHLLKPTAVPSLSIHTPRGPGETESVMEEDSTAESPVASEDLLLECEEDDLEPWQESPENDSQEKREEEEPAVDGPDGEMEADGEMDVFQAQCPDSPIIKIIPIPTDVLPDPASSPPGHNVTLKSSETSPQPSQSPQLYSSTGSPLGFILNGQPITLQPGEYLRKPGFPWHPGEGAAGLQATVAGGGAELKILSQPDGSASGFTTLQIPVTLTFRSPAGVKTISTMASGKVTFSSPSSSSTPTPRSPDSTPTPAPTPIITGVVSGSTAEEVALLGHIEDFTPKPPPMLITGVVSGSAAEKVVREHSLNFTPEPPGVVPSPPLPALMPQALTYGLALAKAQNLPAQPLVLFTSQSPLSPASTSSYQPAAAGTCPSTRKLLHKGMTGPVKPPDCPLCRSQFKVIHALRGFMCLCSTQIARSLNHYYKAKFKNRDSFKSSKSKRKKDRRSSRGSSSMDKDLSPGPTARKVLSPTASKVLSPTPSQPETAASPERTRSALPPETQMGKLIVLVEDFYYGTDRRQRLSNSSQLPEKSGPYRCIHCHQMLSNNIELMEHTKQHAEVISQQDGEMNRQISCQHCYRTFKSPFRLQCHLEAVHSQYESNTKCQICEWAYENEPAFLIHMKNKHKPGEMPYVCQVCEYRSSFYSSVSSHFNEVHADTNNLLCPYCFKVHRSGAYYQQHCVRHLKKKVFGCNKCRLHFVYAKERSDHQDQHHKTHIRPPQLDGLAPGTKVTVRTYSVVGGPVKEGSIRSLIPVTKVIDVPPGTPPLETPRKKPVESLGTILYCVGEDGSVSDQTRCVECLFKIPDISNHFPTLVHCSLCKYLTCCSRAYANHMINDHSSRKSPAKYQTMYQSYPWLAERLKCLSCTYSTATGDTMANHLSDHPDHWAGTTSWTDHQEAVADVAEEDTPDKAKRRRRDATQRRVTRVEVLDMRKGVLETVTRRKGGSFVPIHLLPNGTPSTHLSIHPLTSPPSLCSTPAMTVKFLAPRLSSVENGEVLMNGDVGRPRRPLAPPEPLDPLTDQQLRVVLYALCNGLPQAAQKYHTAPLLIRAWTVQRDRLRATKEWRWNTDRIAEWVLAQREQQLPITEQNLLQMAKEKLEGANEMGDFHEWAVDFMLRQKLSLQPTVRAKRKSLPWNIYEKTRTFTHFINKQVKSRGFIPGNIGTIDELSVFVDPAGFATQNPSAFQLFGTSESPLFDVVLSGLSDGTFLSPVLFFRGERPELPEGFPDNVHLEAQPQGFTDQHRLHVWLHKIWLPRVNPHVDPQNEGRGLLILDTHRGHLGDEFLAELSSAHTFPAVIPIGCSCRLQALDVCVTPVVREFLQARWSQLVSSGGSEGLELDQLALTLACWLSEVASTLKQMPEILRRSFTMVRTPLQDEGEEGPGWMVKALTEALIGQPVAEELPGEPMEVLLLVEEEKKEEKEKEGSVAEDQGGLKALRQVFEKDSDLESFHGFEEKEINECLPLTDSSSC